MNEIEITSIRMSKDETEIGFTQVHGSQIVTSTLVDAMSPAPEFQNAFTKLKTLANEVLDGLLKSEALKKIKPTKVNFKTNDNGAIGCIISLSAEIETSQRPFHFNTPLKYTLAEGQEESDFFLSGKSKDLLAELKRLANDFMSGVHAQQDMFEQEAPPTKNSKGLKEAIEKANSDGTENKKLADKKQSSTLVEANLIEEGNRLINEKFST